MEREKLEELKSLIEELCKKGKAYRAKRMRAGEKSSAYLSGRAVKVCKGQMKGEAKQDTRFTVDGKPVDLGSIEMDGLENMRRYGPDDGGPDAYILSAEFIDGTPLSDIQREKFQDEYPEITHEKALEQMYQQEGAVGEGSCGYTQSAPGGEELDTPGDTQGMDADNRTKTIIKKLIQKEIAKLHENR